jgi:hypothetical protein
MALAATPKKWARFSGGAEPLRSAQPAPYTDGIEHGILSGADVE